MSSHGVWKYMRLLFPVGGCSVGNHSGGCFVGCQMFRNSVSCAAVGEIAVGEFAGDDVVVGEIAASEVAGAYVVVREIAVSEIAGGDVVCEVAGAEVSVGDFVLDNDCSNFYDCLHDGLVDD
uniref:Uncharacterized protein n=1 Tax=Arion vulgaris TaxID=1028688 RepID=A0A0B6Z7C6_9EUPU